MKYIITFFVLFGCTFFAFDLVFTAHTTLFWIDLLLTCVSECIFLANLPILTKDKVSSLSSIVGGVYANICGFVLIAWMLIYNLALKEDHDISLFIVGILIIIGASWFIGFMTSTTIGKATEKQNTLDSVVVEKRNFKEEVSDYAFKTQRAMRELTFDGKEQTVKAYKIAIDKACSLPSFIFEKKQQESEKIVMQLYDISEICNKDTWNDHSIKELNEKIEDLMYIIKTLK